ncbi:hypothetical protein HU200_065023 [Digitaria exilis]|uniref:Uncharacterized protein n=1 Tax=Digitaria exilis TaxID=1010633 RepID=A0A835A0W9_9POAL|nr:hypothetical protein HU200_065023 [Digitaria exilis]
MPCLGLPRFHLAGTSNGFRPLPRIERSSIVAGFSTVLLVSSLAFARVALILLSQQGLFACSPNKAAWRKQHRQAHDFVLRLERPPAWFQSGTGAELAREGSDLYLMEAHFPPPVIDLSPHRAPIPPAQMVHVRSFPGYSLSSRSSDRPLSRSPSTSPPPASSQPLAVGTVVSSSSLLVSVASSSTPMASSPMASSSPMPTPALASSSAVSAAPVSLAPASIVLPSVPILEVAEEAVILPAAPIPEEAEEWSDEDSGSECETDSSDDRLHGYKCTVPSDDDLHIYLCPEDLTWGCPWETIHVLRDHVVGQATSMALREDYKKWSRHRCLAQNMGWSLPGQH